MSARREHALVLGAGVGGLLAARALSGHFKAVTLVERDALPNGPESRKGVPQGRHAHGLLARGLAIMETWFPGFTADLIAHGGADGDVGQKVGYLGYGVVLRPVETGLTAVAVPRPLLEYRLRRHLLERPNVFVRDGLAIDDVVYDPENARVTGAVVRTAGGAAEHIAADLVVDARGRGAPVALVLRKWGFDAAPEEAIEIGLGYTRRVYRRREGDLGGRIAVIIPGGPPNWRTGVIVAHGEDGWMVTIGGYFGDHPPADEAGYLAFARSLPTQDIAEVMARGEPLSDFASFNYPASRRRRFAGMRFPSGYLPFADAICSFNPVYGQGMTVAAEQSEILDRLLRAREPSLAPAFFAKADAIIDRAWAVSAGNDLRHPDVTTRASLPARVINRYIGRVHRAAARDPVVSRAFIRVANMIDPPPSLFAPAILSRVMLARAR
ncbi:hypothetical protein OF829_12370 [Sphingomonas sp. LB-2]|uniref:FAD-dependent oxidoreductase n=1 Tax=Sphingomonas caeni TaxID=2984949 RepID=UPI002230115D|nr:hypothetical protein [Sphingomonas caeni]MCW3848036.1 hypothetical protein [Sphingomonas caeni]